MTLPITNVLLVAAIIVAFAPHVTVFVGVLLVLALLHEAGRAVQVRPVEPEPQLPMKKGDTTYIANSDRFDDEPDE